MNFQEAHKKLFNGPFGKPKQVPHLLMRLSEIRYKDFNRFENEISIVVTHILKLLNNRKFDDTYFWHRLNNNKPRKLFWGSDEKYLKELFARVQITNSDNLDTFHWPSRLEWKRSAELISADSTLTRQSTRTSQILDKIDSNLKSKLESAKIYDILTLIVSLKDKKLENFNHLTDRKEIVRLHVKEMKDNYGETLKTIDNLGVKRNGGEFSKMIMVRGYIDNLIKVIALEDVDCAIEDSELRIIR